MRVLVVNDFTPGGPGSGGAEIACAAGAEALRSLGHEVDMFAADSQLPAPGPMSYIDSARARRLLADRIAAFNPDVVHLHNIYHRLSPGILATLDSWKRTRAASPGPRPRVVMTLHDYHLVCPNAGLRCFSEDGFRVADPERLSSLAYLLTNRWDHRGLIPSSAKLLQHVWNYRIRSRRRVIDALISPSRFTASVVERALGPVSPSVAVVPNPLDVPPRLPQSPTASDKSLTLLFAGRVEPEKGLPDFISLLRGLEELRVQIIGDGSDLDSCRDAARRAGIPIETPGWLPHPETLVRIAKADAVVLPSRWPENAPVCLFEALALGKPILVSDAGGMREIVDEAGFGIAFDPFDERAVRSAVDSLRSISAPDGAAQVKIDAMLAQRTRTNHARGLERVYAGSGCGFS